MGTKQPPGALKQPPGMSQRGRKPLRADSTSILEPGVGPVVTDAAKRKRLISFGSTDQHGRGAPSLARAAAASEPPQGLQP